MKRLFLIKLSNLRLAKALSTSLSSSFVLVFLIAFLFESAVSIAQETPQSDSSGSVGSTPNAALPPPLSTRLPNVRPKPPEDSNKESSSFIGDPESLDPLRTRSENLKGDAEPVLEDIKHVLDMPPQPPVPDVVEQPAIEDSNPKKSSKSKVSAKSDAEKLNEKPKEDSTVKPKAKPKLNAKVKSKSKGKSKLKNKSEMQSATVSASVGPDDPDENLERQFYRDYMRYSAEPTSVEAWTAVTLGRLSEVYIVQKGDTLWTISETLFGDSLFWPKIWSLNRQGILNPHFILPGMKVYFYPGTSADEIPTLGVGEEGVGSSSADSSHAGSADGGVKPNANADSPPEIPPSLPVYRSELYFGQPKRVEILEMSEPEKITSEHPVEVFLTDRMVLSDLKIGREGDLLFNCAPGEIIQNVEFIRRAPTQEYTALQVLDPVKLDKKSVLYSYRRVGTIELYGDSKLKIKQCNSYLSAEHLFVPTSVVESLKSKKMSTAEPRIIGGPTTMDQENFYAPQNIYLDMGHLNFAVGEVFGIKSNRIDSVAGKVKILDRFGSFALGTIIEESNPIATGDKILGLSQ